MLKHTLFSCVYAKGVFSIHKITETTSGEINCHGRTSQQRSVRRSYSFRTQSRACRPMCYLQPIIEPATASDPLRSKCLCIVLLILDGLHINKTIHICKIHNVHIIVAYIATNTRLHKTTSIRYTLYNHKINYVICGGQISIYKVIIRLQKCPLEANIESACEEWRCDSYEVASNFYAMLGAKM